MGEFGIEEIAVENKMNSRPAKYQHNTSTKDTRAKRAWELDDHSKDKDEKMVFNPTNDPELADVQEKIDNAHDANTAYSIFASFTGNAKGKFRDVKSTAKNLDINILKTKLKHMARVVIDYPELRGQIGDMKAIEKTKTVKDKKGKKVKKDNDTIMATDSTLGNRRKATIFYNAHMDRKGAEEEREHMNWQARRKNKFNAPLDYAGTHELGHVLASTLQDPENETEAIRQGHFNQVESSLLRGAANTAYFKNKMSIFDRNKLSETEKTHDFIKGKELKEVDPQAAGLFEAGHTSEYGAENPAEFFAEAVSDVYAHGKDAKPMSVYIVQEYEKRRTNAAKNNFFVQQKKQPNLFQKFLNLFKFW